MKNTGEIAQIDLDELPNVAYEDQSDASNQIDSLKLDSLHNSEQKSFLGQPMSDEEYLKACQNLQAFFELLSSWRDGGSDEKT